MSNLIEFPGGHGNGREGDSVDVPAPESPATPAPAPAVDPEKRHALEVRLDIARECVLLWRIAVVVATLVGLFLIRNLVLS